MSGEGLGPQMVPEPSCHIQDCERAPLEGFPVCGPCRLSYLNGLADASLGEKRNMELCSSCGHFVHPGISCSWHGGTCDEATADPSLWCPCNGERPFDRDIAEAV